MQTCLSYVNAMWFIFQDHDTCHSIRCMRLSPKLQNWPITSSGSALPRACFFLTVWNATRLIFTLDHFYACVVFAGSTWHMTKLLTPMFFCYFLYLLSLSSSCNSQQVWGFQPYTIRNARAKVSILASIISNVLFSSYYRNPMQKWFETHTTSDKTSELTNTVKKQTRAHTDNWFACNLIGRKDVCMIHTTMFFFSRLDFLRVARHHRNWLQAQHDEGRSILES